MVYFHYVELLKTFIFMAKHTRTNLCIVYKHGIYNELKIF